MCPPPVATTSDNRLRNCLTLCVVGVVGVLVRTHDAPLKSFRELKLKVGQSTQLLPVLQIYFRFDQDDVFHAFF